MIDPMKRLGVFIRAAREKKSISQEKLAKLIEYDRNNILKIEAGRRLPPNDLLERISQVVEVPYERLIALKTLDRVDDEVKKWLKIELEALQL